MYPNTNLIENFGSEFEFKKRLLSARLFVMTSLNLVHEKDVYDLGTSLVCNLCSRYKYNLKLVMTRVDTKCPSAHFVEKLKHKLYR